MTLVERCYDNINMIDSGDMSADIVVDMSTCVLLRDVSLLRDTQLSQKLALNVSSLESNFLRCCVILGPLQRQPDSSR